MDPKRTVDEKLEAIRKRFMAWKAVSRSMGIPVRHAWDMTMKAVSGTVSKREQGTFKRALLSIKARASEQRRQDVKQEKESIARLRALPPGTRIKIKDGDTVEEVIFIEAKRSRFIAEFHDGRRFSVPASMLVEIFQAPPAR
ncbi:MAG: hypothetical protein DPW13_06670 [Planctomycetes bacterium]|nr:hypothetical protein [Planctomycetota bacterium]